MRAEPPEACTRAHRQAQGTLAGGQSARQASTNLEIGIGGDVVALDPPVLSQAVAVDGHPGAVRQPAEQSPVFQRQSDEPARTYPTGQSVGDNDDSRPVLRRLDD